MTDSPRLEEIFAELDALYAKATAGQWDTSWKYGDAKTERYCILGPTQYADPIVTTSRREQGSHDAEWIAAVHNAWPAIRAALEDS